MLVSGVLAVDAVDVTKRYGALVAVDGISVQVAQGEVYGVLGPNGAGKTTFMRMLFGLIRPDAGEIRLFGRTWAEDGTRMLDSVAGFVETPRFYPYLTGRENLAGLARLDVGIASDRVDEVLEIVDLADRADDRVRGYSYGMVQRLGLAASLLRRPQLLIVDEPANGLDPAGIRDMRALIKRLAASGLTVLLSSHDMAEVEEICDNVTIMREGTVVFHGAIAELRAQAPEQGHRISTDDDERALGIARRHTAARGRAGRGRRPDRARPAGTRSISSCAPLSSEGLALRALELSEAPLETLFFMLTESHSDASVLAPSRGRGLTVSTTEVAPSLPASAVHARRPGLGSALGWELSKLFKQKRAPLTLAFAAIAPILIVIILKGQQRPPKDSLFGRYIHQTGWSVPLSDPRLRGPVGAAASDRARGRRHLRRRGPDGHLEDGAHPLGQPHPDLLGEDDHRRRLRAQRPRRAHDQHDPQQRRARRPPAPRRTDRPGDPVAHGCAAGQRELGDGDPAAARLHLLRDPALGAEPQPGLRDRGTGRDRDGDAARRLPRRRRGAAAVPADDAVRGLARPARPARASTGRSPGARSAPRSGVPSRSPGRSSPSAAAT